MYLRYYLSVYMIYDTLAKTDNLIGWFKYTNQTANFEKNMFDIAEENNFDCMYIEKRKWMIRKRSTQKGQTPHRDMNRTRGYTIWKYS